MVPTLVLCIFWILRVQVVPGAVLRCAMLPGQPPGRRRSSISDSARPRWSASTRAAPATAAVPPLPRRPVAADHFLTPPASSSPEPAASPADAIPSTSSRYPQRSRTLPGSWHIVARGRTSRAPAAAAAAAVAPGPQRRSRVSLTANHGPALRVPASTVQSDDDEPPPPRQPPPPLAAASAAVHSPSPLHLLGSLRLPSAGESPHAACGDACAGGAAGCAAAQRRAAPPFQLPGGSRGTSRASLVLATARSQPPPPASGGPRRGGGDAAADLGGAMEPAQVGEEGADSDGEECEDPEQGAEGPEDAQPQPPAAELRLVCRVCSSAGASGQGFRGVRGYLQHLTRSHLDAAPEELLYVGEPWLLNTTTVVRVPRALITCGLVASDHEERADIPLRPGAVLPLTNPRGLRPAGAGPGAHDLDFLLCLDVSKLRSMRALPLLAEPGFGTAEGMGSAIALCATLATHPDPRRQQCGAIALALSGVMLLAVEKRGQRLSNAQRRARLDLFCAGDFRTLLTAFCANHEKQRKADLAALRGRPRVTLRQLVGAEQDLAALTRRAVKQGDAGSLRKLMDTLRNSVVGGKGAEVLPHMEAAQVQPAFPATEEQEAAIKNFAPAALHVVDPAILRTALEGMRPDAAGGPNGKNPDRNPPEIKYSQCATYTASF